jgi:hypothetical protein
MDKLVVPDCPECGGRGDVPFDPDDAVSIICRRPCGTCVERWHAANPLPRQSTVAKLQAENTKLRAVADAAREAVDCLDLSCRQGVEAQDALSAALEALAKPRTET